MSKLLELLNPHIGIKVMDVVHPVKITDKVTVMPWKEADKVPKGSDIMIICPRLGFPTDFTGNKVGKCFKCKNKIFFRPDLPKVGKKICLECMEEMINESEK